MKLTPLVIAGADAFLNPAGDRVLSLRGLRAPMIESMGDTEDSYETIDLTDNDIRVLGNFPKLIRLKTILIARNRVDTIHESLPESLPNLRTISLTANNVRSLADLEPLQRCKKLENLYLAENPVALSEYYRPWLIWRIPSLKIIDFERVKEKERSAARELFGTHDSPSELALQISRDAEMSTKDKHVDVMINRLTPEARAKLEEELKTATTLAEIDRIETALKTGRL